MEDDKRDQDRTPEPTPPEQEEITGTPDPAYEGGDYNFERYDEDIPTGDAGRKKKKFGDPIEPSEPRRRGRRWPVLFMGGCLGLLCLCCIVPICVTAVAAGGIAAIASNTEATTTVTETIEVDPETPVSLTVDNEVGAVTIEQGLSDEVEIEYTKRAYGWNNERAENELDNIEVLIEEPEANAVQISVDTERDRDTVWSNASNVELTIQVPESVHLTITNRVGGINIRGVRAESLDLNADVGGIVFEGELANNPDATFRAETATGGTEFRLPADVYVTIDAEVDVGDVNVDDTFDSIDITEDERNVTDARWLGTLGSGEGDAPTLTLRANTGGVSVQVR